MIEHALAVLETAVHNIYDESQQTPDVWEALRAVRAAGADPWMLEQFWRHAGAFRAGQIKARGHEAYQGTTSAMNGICRCLGIERTYQLLNAWENGHEARSPA